MNTSLAAVSRADDEHEKAELIALVRQLTPKEVDRVIERMQALLNGKQDEQEVAECRKYPEPFLQKAACARSCRAGGR